MITDGINFLNELEKLKAVDRRSYPIGLNRKENSAEHSWSLAMAVMTIAPLVDTELDVFRAIQMALIHDVVEIDAGDTFCYADQSGKYEKELSAAKRIFGILPSPLSQTYLELWQEFEHRSTKEALFVNAFDRILPLIQNHNGEGRSWTENQVYYEQAFERNQTIKDGSEELWIYALQIMDAARKSGWLPSKSDQDGVINSESLRSST
ncbi:HD domain-containing protein [Cerasicoccus arenae]|uniref:Hydrolase n=1 Tax=Cerasicoccus arenae TaxID=424488 RepID=A0A8J3DEJ2_9BACT|nr:HD domain-containing protein [Cerasicoccus arenae]MBK1856838.1 HD domain-containing protein [Cerasicoccus arenae]GHC11179.1 hydrolase [Cerasicoccus arenae]